MKRFEYRHAASVSQACDLLALGGAMVNAGGTDLMGLLKDEVLPEYPSMLVNLKSIPGLDAIAEDEGGVRLGALVTIGELASSPLLLEKYPVLARAALEVASPQIRNVGTLGGNLCQETRCWYYRYPKHVGGPLMCLRKGSGSCLAVKGDNRHHSVLGGKKCFSACPSDTAVALAALDATLSVEGARGRRRVPVVQFYTPLGTVLEKDEIVTGVVVPNLPEGSIQTFLKFTVRKPIDFAVASVAAVLVMDAGVCVEARLALGAVAPMPWRAREAESVLKGKRLTATLAGEAAEAALADARPLSGNAHKVEIAKALVRQAVMNGAGSQP